jgi:DNA helicase-2/ATP-dependent DNA helicase PcrA
MRTVAGRGGAGTGKTETIAHRAAWLAMQGVDPARMLLLTFTRRAAGQMRRRAHDIMRQALGDTLGNKAQAMLQRLVWAGTFHSIGNRLLRHYGRHLNLEPGYTVIDRSDSADLFDNLRQELKLGEQFQRFPRKDTCLAIYSWRINTQRARTRPSSSSSSGASAGSRIWPSCVERTSSASSAAAARLR